MWNRVLNKDLGGKNLFFALAFLTFAPVSVVHAGLDDFYVGGSYLYINPDSNRMTGDTAALGLQLGYELNRNWDFEAGYQSSAGRHGLEPWGARVRMHDLQFVRHWGDKYRFLVEFGYTHLSMNVNAGAGVDDAVASYHLGAGVSTFLTQNLELRADAKLLKSPNENYLDSIGVVSLNWHFGSTGSSVKENDSTAAANEGQESKEELPPMSYREPAEAVAPVETVAPAPEEIVAPAPVEAAPAPAPVEATVAPAVQPVEPAAETFVAPGAVPTSTHTFLNFGSGSVDTSAESATLDKLSEEIKSTNAKAVIEGYTDSKGSEMNNKVLSLDRAIVVKRELKKRGVNGDRLRAVGMGESQPVATNDTAAGRAQNRRVEVKIFANQQ